jgi:hypothetical protein
MRCQLASAFGHRSNGAETNLAGCDRSASGLASKEMARRFRSVSVHAVGEAFADFPADCEEDRGANNRNENWFQ